MRKLGCFSAVATALLMAAGTAHADPFSVTADMQAPRDAAIQSTRGVDDLWFNSIIKVNGSTPERLFLADSIIVFGGDAVSVPNDAISFTITPNTSTTTADSSGKVRGWVSHGDNGFFLSGGVDTLSAAVGSHSTVSMDPPQTRSGSSSGATSGAAPNISLNVPGASGAFDPLSPNLGAIGVVVLNGNQQLNGAIVGTTQFLTALENDLMGGSSTSASANTDPVVDPLPITTAAVTDPAGPVPVTPEPSPLLLLGAGLGFVVVLKRNAFGFGNA